LGVDFSKEAICKKGKPPSSREPRSEFSGPGSGEYIILNHEFARKSRPVPILKDLVAELLSYDRLRLEMVIEMTNEEEPSSFWAGPTETEYFVFDRGFYRPDSSAMFSQRPEVVQTKFRFVMDFIAALYNRRYDELQERR
jgi:hypothetical protein